MTNEEHNAADSYVAAGSRWAGGEMPIEHVSREMPEDVAALYLWANLPDAKYRDFSASRREYRSQVWDRADKALRERELETQVETEPPQGNVPEDASGFWAADQPAGQDGFADALEQPLGEARDEELETTPGFGGDVPDAPAVDSHVTNFDRAMLDQEIDDEAAERFDLGVLDTGADADSGVAAGFDAHPHPQSVFDFDFDSSFDFDSQGRVVGPAWLYSGQSSEPQPTRGAQMVLQRRGGDTLQDSRERVAARWLALKGVFEDAGRELPAMQPAQAGEAGAPLLLVFSLAGGVGKTSLAATLGKVLSSRGEKVLLADTTSHGLLSYYFGALGPRPGEVHSFTAPPESEGAALSLASYDVASGRADQARQEEVLEEIFRDAQESNRVVMDLAEGAGWLIRRFAGFHPTVLVPVTPDMSSVISLGAVERIFQEMANADGGPLVPFYVLNQFDASLPLHLDVREVLRRQLGNRLLSFVIRRSPMVSEALAEGMTVLDYAPEAAVSRDYLDVAAWLQRTSPPTTAGFAGTGWSRG